jgi:hypothetical protein
MYGLLYDWWINGGKVIGDGYSTRLDLDSHDQIKRRGKDYRGRKEVKREERSCMRTNIKNTRTEDVEEVAEEGRKMESGKEEVER